MSLGSISRLTTKRRKNGTYLLQSEPTQTLSWRLYNSRHGSSKPEMVEELKQMMEGTNDPAVKAAISEAILKMNK